MIKTEIVTINNKMFKHTFSDLNKQIMREDGAVFDDAYDVVDHTYIETEIDIEVLYDE